MKRRRRKGRIGVVLAVVIAGVVLGVIGVMMSSGPAGATSGIIVGVGIMLLGAAPAWYAGAHRRGDRRRGERGLGVAAQW